MIICPVCETQQASGVECDVCGRAFPMSLVAGAGHLAPPPEPLPGLEPTVLDAPVEKTAAVAADAPCVWCGHVQAAGLLCDRCGMQRHRGAQPKVEAAGPDGLVLCPECGLRVQPGGRCPNCAGRLPSGNEG